MAKSDKQKEDQNNQRSQRQISREDRTARLLEATELSEAEQKELNGLSKFEEQYSSAGFTDDHRAFKATHNRIFLQLSRYCQAGNVFYLDGPCAETTKALSSGSIETEHCYTANRHASTFDALKNAGLQNVVHASAQVALRGVWQDVGFCAYYFDGCGGYTPVVCEMMEAAFFNRRIKPPIAVGFSILGGGRDVVDKEQNVLQNLVQLVKPFRVERVGDDPTQYGVVEDMQKVESSTLTTWCMIVEP